MQRDAIERQCDEFTRSRGILFTRPARDLLFMSLDAMTTDPTELPNDPGVGRHRQLADAQTRLIETELYDFLTAICDAATAKKVSRITYFDMLRSTDGWIEQDKSGLQTYMSCIDPYGPARIPRSP